MTPICVRAQILLDPARSVAVSCCILAEFVDSRGVTHTPSDAFRPFLRHHSMEVSSQQSIFWLQFHEVVGFFGGPWVQGIGQFLCALSLFGTGIAQVCTYIHTQTEFPFPKDLCCCPYTHPRCCCNFWFRTERKQASDTVVSWHHSGRFLTIPVRLQPPSLPRHEQQLAFSASSTVR